MLFQLLDELCDRISNLDVKTEAPAFAEQMARGRPELAKLWRSGGETCRLIMTASAQGLLQRIKKIPSFVHRLVQEANEPETESAMRTALLGVLAYLVQPRDLIPDDAPGGYGYLDDYLLLRVALLEYLHEVPEDPVTEKEREQGHVESMASSLPQDRIPEFQAAVDGLLSLYQYLTMLPSELHETTAQQLIDDPLQASAMLSGSTPTPGNRLSNPHVTVTPGGGSILTENDSTSVSFAGGGGAAMVGKDIVTW